MKFNTGLLYLAGRVCVLWAVMGRRIESAVSHEDMLPVSFIPSFALGDWRDRVLAEIDQDGFAFAVDPLDAEVFNSKPAMTARKHHRIQIVLRAGRVSLRKAPVNKPCGNILDRVFAFLKWEFYIETAALLRLQGLGCVPTVRRIDVRERAIEMDYIWGRDLRQILADGAQEIPYEEISRSFSVLAARESRDEIWGQVAEVVAKIVGRGVIPRDVHAANFVLGRRSRRLYMVDFDLVYLYPVPGWRAHARTLNWLFKDSGGDASAYLERTGSNQEGRI
jgi:hypothetical protein